MRKIIINSKTHGVKEVLIDDEDYDRCANYTWYIHKHRKTFYARRNDRSEGEHKNIKMHRFILKENNPDITIDHRDNNGLNNQKSNLRKCTNSQNQANRPRRKNCKSIFKGVTTSTSKTNPWRAQIKKEGRVKGLGNFKTEVEAAVAYDEAAKNAHGEYAYLNF